MTLKQKFLFAVHLISLMLMLLSYLGLVSLFQSLMILLEILKTTEEI